VHRSLARHTVAHLFGDVWQDPTLELTQRSLITCAALVATGRESEQRLHFRGARNLGISRDTLEATITHVAHYAGWPVAVSASRTLAEVWDQMDGESR
jgi:4-carboxymuconolactone decarboxylase